MILTVVRRGPPGGFRHRFVRTSLPSVARAGSGRCRSHELGESDDLIGWIEPSAEFPGLPVFQASPVLAGDRRRSRCPSPPTSSVRCAPTRISAVSTHTNRHSGWWRAVWTRRPRPARARARLAGRPRPRRPRSDGAYRATSRSCSTSWPDRGRAAHRSEVRGPYPAAAGRAARAEDRRLPGTELGRPSGELVIDSTGAGSARRSGWSRASVGGRERGWSSS